VILADLKYSHYLDVYSRNRVEVVTSLPDLRLSKTDRQRGLGSHEKIITIIKDLNKRGYGTAGSDLKIHLVHNPLGAYLPGSQSTLEYEYRERLLTEYGITFNNLFSITNNPVGRYLNYLVESDNLDDYMTALCEAFNPLALENVMCKNTISVSWDRNFYAKEEKTLYLSSIFKWYRKDFIKAEGSLKKFVAPYITIEESKRKEIIDKDIDIEFLDYNWDLNSIK